MDGEDDLLARPSPASPHVAVRAGVAALSAGDRKREIVCVEVEIPEPIACRLER